MAQEPIKRPNIDGFDFSKEKIIELFAYLADNRKRNGGWPEITVYDSKDFNDSHDRITGVNGLYHRMHRYRCKRDDFSEIANTIATICKNWQYREMYVVEQLLDEPDYIEFTVEVCGGIFLTEKEG
jgi:hypothetical protein